MSEFDAMILENIEIMNKLDGFHVVIVCCSSSKQAEFWQHRLEGGKGSIIGPNTIILAVEEDWPGGAGNALGTLYAFTKADKLAKETLKINLLEMLTLNQVSIGLFHTAGKGTRLAPLPGSENNNKPGVKLPANIVIDGVSTPITILEAVIKQTGCYAPCRLGRLSVFWGDQVFIPTVPVAYQVTCHADILCSLGPMPTEAVWKEKGLDKYGLIAQSLHSAAQVEKVDHATAVQLLASIGEIVSVGASLGSFSISHQLLTLFLDEFKTELISKIGKLDTDPHWWMPMTLSKASYLHLMKQKGTSEETSLMHYDRIASMMTRFQSIESNKSLGIFGPVDVGPGVYWWDYGQLKLYYKNTLLMIERSREAELMRLFLGIKGTAFVQSSVVMNTDIDVTSCLSTCSLGSDSNLKGFVRNSALSNVRCKYIEAEDCILINVTAERIIAKPGSIIYNVVFDERMASTATTTSVESTASSSSTASALIAEAKDILVGVFDETGAQIVMKSHLDTDGGKAWSNKVSGNEFSFEEIYDANANACPRTLKTVISVSHDNFWKSIC